uniref:lipoyl(octanoyl) transferase LipB n=1 Tax=Ornithobacterium rhinotracheale TaxID=28251 RepID=UPI0039A572FD
MKFKRAINKKIEFKDLGENQDYQQIWDFQEQKLKQIVAIKMNLRQLEREYENARDVSQCRAIANEIEMTKTPNFLYFVQHPHVYTLGKSGDEHNMLANAEKLKEIQATYIKTNRGGDITYHGPEQLVGYPILDLENFKTDIHWYLRNLEEVIIKTIGDYGLKGERSRGETGVWLDVGKPYARKICAMGVKASRWVTMHGFALNVNTDLKYFEYIIPCGIKDKAVASLERELGRKIDINEVKERLKRHFCEVFECEII